MTNREKFIEVFGDNPQRHHITKSWWDEKYVLPQEPCEDLYKLIIDDSKLMLLENARTGERTVIEKHLDTCEDAISRQAVLEPYKYLKDDDVISVWLIKKNIEQQKSVIPIRSKGHWIDMERCQECSECGEIQYGYDSFRHFCANCGADMREGE